MFIRETEICNFRDDNLLHADSVDKRMLWTGDKLNGSLYSKLRFCGM